MRHALYIIGPPGVGKTRLMTALLAKFANCAEEHAQPFVHVEYPGGVMLGGRREGFGGTDQLSMSVQPLVEDWIANTLPQRVVGEGDRLANEKFFTFLRKNGYNLCVVSLGASQPTLDARRAQRGSTQNPTWMKGRETKARNLANNWARRVIDTDDIALELIVETLKWQPALNLG